MLVGVNLWKNALIWGHNYTLYSHTHTTGNKNEFMHLLFSIVSCRSAQSLSSIYSVRIDPTCSGLRGYYINRQEGCPINVTEWKWIGIHMNRIIHLPI